MRRTGDEIVTGVAFAPVDNDGTEIVGEIIDRLGFESGVFTALFGVTSGTPSAVSIPLKFYHSNKSDMSDEVEVVANTVTVVDPADGAKQEVNVNFVPLKRYVRQKPDAAFTGGTTPKIFIAGSYALGQKKTGPAT